MYHRRKTGNENTDKVIDDIYKILNRLQSVPNTASVNTNYLMTPEGGFAVRITNGESFSVPKGYLVKQSTSANRTVVLAAEDDFEISGVVYDSLPAGGEGYIVVSGIADIWFNSNGSTRGEYFRMSRSDDTAGADDGKAESDPVNRPRTLQLLGYILDTRSGEGLARCIIKR